MTPFSVTTSPTASRFAGDGSVTDHYLAALIPGWFPGISSAEYSRCIGGFAPLTEDDEAALVKQIKAGLPGRVALMEDSAALVVDLQDLVATGENAIMRLVQANLKLVVGIAKQYAGRDVPLMDLVRSGNAGLVRAAEASGQYAGHYRFPAFSQRWIRQGIENSLKE